MTSSEQADVAWRAFEGGGLDEVRAAYDDHIAAGAANSAPGWQAVLDGADRGLLAAVEKLLGERVKCDFWWALGRRSRPADLALAPAYRAWMGRREKELEKRRERDYRREVKQREERMNGIYKADRDARRASRAV